MRSDGGSKIGLNTVNENLGKAHSRRIIINQHGVAIRNSPTSQAHKDSESFGNINPKSRRTFFPFHQKDAYKMKAGLSVSNEYRALTKPKPVSQTGHDKSMELFIAGDKAKSFARLPKAL